MKRRDLSALLLTSVSGSALLARPSTTHAGCSPTWNSSATPAETTAGVTPSCLQFPPGNVLRYGADPTGVSSSQSAFVAARAVAAASGTPVSVVFPEGTYLYSSSPDWRVPNITLQALGRVELKYTGSGSAWVFGNAGNTTHVNNCHMLGDFIVNGQGCGNGLFCENVHRSTIQCRVKNVAEKAFVVNGCVLTKFELNCSVNEQAMTTAPDYGLMVNHALHPASPSPVYAATTDCQFELVVEGVLLDGVVLNQCVASSFSGTSEGNGQRGILADVGAMLNTFNEFFMEVNAGGDIVCNGAGNHWTNCSATSRAAQSPYESLKSIIFGSTAARNIWFGGYFYASQVSAGAKDNGFLWFSSEYKVIDSGTQTSIYGRQLYISSNSLPAQIPIQDGWSTLANVNSWTNTSASFQFTRYSINRSSREVLVQGEAGGGSAGTVIAILPAGYRPSKIFTFLAPATAGSNYAIVKVLTNGDIQHVSGATASIDLSTIRFFV